MFFVESAYAQGVEGSKTFLQQFAGNPLILIVVFFVILYFLMIRPQQKRQKKLNETINALKAGDRVMMTCGIYGTIDSVIDAQAFVLTIASGVKIQIARAAIASKVDQTPTMSDKR